MGLISHLLSISIGAYAGAYVAQNYEIPKLPLPSQLTEKAEDATGSLNNYVSHTLESLQIPVVPSLQHLHKQLEEYLDNFKKPEEKK